MSLRTVLFRLLAALPLVLLAGFACFGFLASFELGGWRDRLPWQVAYGLLGIACLAGLLALCRPRRDAAKRLTDPPR